MKINRSFYTAKRHQSHEGAAETGSTRNRRFIRKGESGFDRVEISQQAKERYEHEMKARDGASTEQNHIEEVLKAQERHFEIERREYLEILKEKILTGHYDAHEPKKLFGAAERLVSQLLKH